MNPRTRIYLSVFAVFVLGVVYLLHRVIDDLEPRYRESVEEPLVDIAQILATLAAGDISGDRIDPDRFRTAFDQLYQRRFLARIYDLEKNQVDLRVYITDRNGIVMFDSAHRDEGKDYSHWNDVRLTLQGRYGARTSRNVAEDPKTSVLYVAAPILYQGEIIGALTVCKPTVNMKAFIETARQQITIAGISTVFAFVGLALLMSLWLVRPHGLIADYARLWRQLRHSPRTQLGRQSWTLLRNAVTDMREALAGRSHVEEYVQALTHEIKSPLSAIRGAAELLQEPMPESKRGQFIRNITTEALRIQEIVDHLLQLAALEKRRNLMPVELIDIDALLCEVFDSVEPVVHARQIKLVSQTAVPLQVLGERFLLHRALSNLLLNALEFSPPGSTVTVNQRLSGKQVAVEIVDEGSGIPAFAVDRIMQRFYSLPRPDSQKRGTGLGLSFVKEIAELHQGRVEITNRPEGGVLAVLWLPAPAR